MKVRDAMTAEVRSCSPEDDLAKAAIEMWNGDCGMVPVVWAGEVIGVLTDRDICMAVALGGARPQDRKVREVMRREVFGCGPDDDLGDALETMATRRVRRLPVIDGDELAGMISMSDIVLHAGAHGGPSAREIVEALRAIRAGQAVAVE